MHSLGEGSLSYSRLLGFTLSASGVDVCAQQGCPSIQVCIMEYFTLVYVNTFIDVHFQYLYMYVGAGRELERGREREREGERETNGLTGRRKIETW